VFFACVVEVGTLGAAATPDDELVAAPFDAVRSAGFCGAGFVALCTAVPAEPEIHSSTYLPFAWAARPIHMIASPHANDRLAFIIRALELPVPPARKT
jgi:hypothetical protein